MKIAIIIFIVLALAFGIAYTLIKTVIENSVVEIYRIKSRHPSVLAGVCGFCRILMYVCAAITITLLLIKFI